MDKFFKHNPIMMIGSAIASHADQRAVEHGDILFFPRTGYYHVAVYVGDRDIIHFSQKTIRRESLEGQVEGRNVYIDLHSHNNSRDEIVNQAKYFHEHPEEIGDYNLLTNNCELFAQKCCGEFSWHQSLLIGADGNAINASLNNAPFAHSRKWNGEYRD